MPRRTNIEPADLKYAIAWERIRAGYFSRNGRLEDATYCAGLADWHEARMNQLLEQQAQAQSDDVAEAA